LKPETGSCNFLKLVLENKRIGVLYRLEPDLQGVENKGFPQVGAWKIGDWCLLELVLKRREIGVSYKL
jgi:hypothetical protein